jgi:hypothetical protein
LAGGWLEKESLALGLAWRSPEDPSSASWPELLALAVENAIQWLDGKQGINTPLGSNGGQGGESSGDKIYREIILDRSFAQDLAMRLIWPQA